MLKIVGTEKGKVVDEKVLITDEGKPSRWLIRFLCVDLAVEFVLFCIVHKLRAKWQGKQA